jgi:hypothetical protein
VSTRGQVVDPAFLSAGGFTGPAGRAAVVRPSLAPRTPLLFWWGDASSSLMSGAPKAAAPSSPAAPAAGAPDMSSRGCCG